jgi:hypothetical protein
VFGDFEFGPDGETTDKDIRQIQVQYHDIVGNDMMQFSDPKHVTVLDPPKYQTGNLIYPFAQALK